MFLIRPSFQIEEISGFKRIERAGRICYKSENKITEESCDSFIRSIIKHKHESVLEHSMLSVKFIVDRGVRHRLAAFSQESTRYCNYKGGVTFVIPPWTDITPGEYGTYERGHTVPASHISAADAYWFDAMLQAEFSYTNALQCGWLPQQARSILPNSTKTELVMTTNFREWRHIFKLRALSEAGKPHPQMLEVMVPLLAEVKNLVPVIFDDLGVQ
jgi:thymidylate synthase (FAD)